MGDAAEVDDLIRRARRHAAGLRQYGYGHAETCNLLDEIVGHLAAPRAGPDVLAGVYIASKTRHGERWRLMRYAGAPIVSTWIDEAEAGATSDWPGLWRRCIAEASSAAVTIVYAEAGEVLKGGWVEVGAALAHGRLVIAVVADEFTVFRHPGIERAGTIEDAFARAAAYLREASR